MCISPQASRININNFFKNKQKQESDKSTHKKNYNKISNTKKLSSRNTEKMVNTKKNFT